MYGKKHTPEAIEKMKAASNREKKSKVMKEYYSNPENREKTSKAMKEYFSNLESTA
jgi:hypothetical protein